MTKRVCIASFCWAAALAACAGAPHARYDTGRLGEVRVLAPHVQARGLVFLLSSRSGWSRTDARNAETLQKAGAIVVGVDFAAYAAALDDSDGECLYLLSEIESLSQQVQRSLDVPVYFSPIVAGAGEAAALAGAALAQTPAATLAGAVSVDPTAAVATRLPLCPGAEHTATPAGFRYGPVGALPGFWSIGFTSRADADGRAHIRDVTDAGTPATIDAQDDTDDPNALVVRLSLARLSPAVSTALPLVELPARNGNGALAIVLSGDGGWRDLDKTIAEKMRAQGTSVIGWDSLRYFWRRRTPDELARDLDDVIRTYSDRWRAPNVMLIGYSFGADVLPFAYNRLPEGSRALVKQVSLLGFSRSADFTVHVTAWLGAGPSAKALPTAPETARIDPALVQCVYGRDEHRSACPDLEKSGAEVIATAGGHHFDSDYDGLAQKILAGLDRRAPRR